MGRSVLVSDESKATRSGEKDSAEQHGESIRFPIDDQLRHTETMQETILNAKSATEKEHSMTLMQGVRLYPKAIVWSILISTCIAMEGYDVCLINNVRLSPTLTASPPND